MAASWVSFARSGGIACVITVDTPGDGHREESIVYNARRWSGPVVLPAFGRLSNSPSANLTSSSPVSLRKIALNNSIACVRTIGLLDFALSKARVDILRNASVVIGREYAWKNWAMAVRQL